MKPAGVAAALLLAAARCLAAGGATDDEAAGLQLADQTPPAAPAVEPKMLQWSIEPALRWVVPRPSGGVRAAQRVSLDLSLRHRLSNDWLLVAADRLDLHGPARLMGEREAINTWKELYASGRFGRETLVDLGRVNARFGVAAGYNPTDYLRQDAVRSATSVDPASLRENRLGTAMLRAQRVWTGGSLTAIVAPRLADAPSDSGLAADLGATNRRNRWLLAWSQRWGEDFAPQWLLYGDGEHGSSPQFGLDLTRLLSPACVAALEWSGARMPTLRARAQQRPDDARAFRSQWAIGATCANAHKLSLTIEWQHNGAALDAAGWRTLRAGPLADYAAYRQEAQARQDPPTRDGVFALARWQGAFVPQLDVMGFTRLNLADHSRLLWLEARYHRQDSDLALQWQRDSGGALSEYGALPQREVWQLLFKRFF